MNRNSLFNRPRIRLSILYASVMGGIFLLLGYITHYVVDKASDRIVDREIHLLSTMMNSKLSRAFQKPGELPQNANQIIPELCVVNQGCQPKLRDAMLLDLMQDGYYLQLLNLQGQPIAAIGELPNRFPPNPHLTASYTRSDQNGVPYHLHLMPLQMQNGQRWGYIQVGRSVENFDEYMRGLHLLIFFGVPLVMLMIGGASWWLAGLAIRPIYQAYEKMQEFTANAAHELRTPIASTKAILEVALEDKNLTLDESRQTLRTLHRQNDRLSRLAQDLLLLSRLDANPSHDLWTPICLNDLVEDLEEDLLSVAMAAGITLNHEIKIDEKIYVNGNSDQIYRLFSNLITNAIQYSSQNGKVVLRLNRNQNQAIISIQDNGIGIPKSELLHLFDRFHRVNSDRNRQSGGAGLGLAIAQAITKSHHGYIQVQSEVGQGSTFTVRLPIFQTQGRSIWSHRD
ncbi:MAG: two-component system sensor histidine kinase RppB [Synechococcales bacterium]|nr:two-component system sensor histidine kinase RppB [Synechococcales bacterium]